MCAQHLVDDRSRGDRTAARLETIAVDLVLQHGLQSVTVDDICARAEVSQRTFFNHFRTKEEAVFGRDVLGLDEKAVREFLTSGTHDVVADVMRLVIATQTRHGDRELLLKRKQLIHANPAMISKHMARMRTVRDELGELVYLRIKNAAPADESEAQTRQVATALAELGALLLRFGMEHTAAAKAMSEPDGAAARLQAVLARALA